MFLGHFFFFFVDRWQTWALNFDTGLFSRLNGLQIFLKTKCHSFWKRYGFYTYFSCRFEIRDWNYDETNRFLPGKWPINDIFEFQNAILRVKNCGLFKIWNPDFESGQNMSLAAIYFFKFKKWNLVSASNYLIKRSLKLEKMTCTKI